MRFPGPRSYDPRGSGGVPRHTGRPRDPRSIDFNVRRAPAGYCDLNLEETLQFLLRHGLVVLFVFVLAEQIGLPLPALPVLLAVGALTRAGLLDLGTTIAVAVAASLLADLVWYEIGRRRGAAVLGFLCRLSLEPDSCVRRTEDLFLRHGATSLIVAKFVPGLNTAAPPLSGMLRMKPWRFLLYDLIGTLLYVTFFIGLGYAFSSQLERALEWAMGLGGAFGVVVFGPLVLYLAFKYVQRSRALRAVYVARIEPDELKRLLDGGAALAIVDMRHAVEIEAEPHTIPGALRLAPEALDWNHAAIPRDREIILFCT